MIELNSEYLKKEEEKSNAYFDEFSLSSVFILIEHTKLMRLDCLTMFSKTLQTNHKQSSNEMTIAHIQQSNEIHAWIMTSFGYSVVELLIQSTIDQLLSIVDYRLDKVVRRHVKD
jgi:hypothetical protein